MEAKRECVRGIDVRRISGKVREWEADRWTNRCGEDCRCESPACGDQARGSLHRDQWRSGSWRNGYRGFSGYRTGGSLPSRWKDTFRRDALSQRHWDPCRTSTDSRRLKTVARVMHLFRAPKRRLSMEELSEVQAMADAGFEG